MILLLIFSQPFKNIKTTFSSRAVQKQAVGWTEPTGCGVSTLGLKGKHSRADGGEGEPDHGARRKDTRRQPVGEGEAPRQPQGSRVWPVTGPPAILGVTRKGAGVGAEVMLSAQTQESDRQLLKEVRPHWG